ncbi:GatB/YqeY domain-containing protein [Thermoleophilia bacterium SCSIO 60948]|nr:GatB/YqeY domain-containing protein [Thermoleophilia bacterium SCSIO 60948]
MSILDQVNADTREAMKARERDRVAALRMIADALQKDAKEGSGNEVAVLRRERKRREEAASAYSDAGDAGRADAERSEAELISGYLPAELSDEELAEIVDAAVAESGAESPKEMGKVMPIAMGRVQGKADGKRVSAAVRERLTGGAG